MPSGRWVDAHKCAASFGRHHHCGTGGGGATSFSAARVWVPFGCGGRRARCAPDIRRCLAGRRLVVVGDSIANGFALDVCERLRGNCSRWPVATGEVVLSATFGNPPRVGLRNVVEGRAAALWTAALAAANNTIVVLQSGAHDIALPPPGMPSKVAPLAAYRHHLRELAHIVARAQAANPTLLVVWRQTTHQLLLDDAGSPDRSLKASQHVGAGLCGLGKTACVFLFCKPRAFPGTHPLAIAALNAAAREILSPLGVIIWEEPAQLTLSAPRGAFRDLQHHDVCGAGADRHDGSNGSRCAAERRAGAHQANGWVASAAERGRAPTWSAMGGVSEAITDTFFTSVLGCKECALERGTGAVGGRPRLR